MAMKQFLVHGRFTFEGHALVDAEDQAEAVAKFNAGDFEFDHTTASCSDWEKHKVEDVS